LAKPDDIKTVFTGIGGTFLTPVPKISLRLKTIKAFIFDWDGVFNTGEKDEKGSSVCSEVDAMGTNLLRFAYWLNTNKLPVTAVLSGEKNRASFYLSQREHFTSCYFKVADKSKAIEHFCNRYAVKPSEIAFVFDDVLDLPVAKTAGLRIFVKRKSNPLLNRYVKKNKLADYITSGESGNFALREACELMIGLQGIYDRVLNERVSYSPAYEKYIDLRNLISTGFYTLDHENIVETDTP